MSGSQRDRESLTDEAVNLEPSPLTSLPDFAAQASLSKPAVAAERISVYCFRGLRWWDGGDVLSAFDLAATPQHDLVITNGLLLKTRCSYNHSHILAQD